ncbi:MAG: hypothetical protein PHC46_00605 [Clostridia bacterium]|nr:hypothetical protein [Clostridia bacterium]
MLKSRHIVLRITGKIVAFKSASLIGMLKMKDAFIDIIIMKSETYFIAKTKKHSK